MRYGGDFEEYQVCAGEADFHVGKASGPCAWLARWVALRLLPASPGEQESSPEQPPEPNATNSLQCDGARREQGGGGGGGGQGSTWELSPKTRSCRL